MIKDLEQKNYWDSIEKRRTINPVIEAFAEPKIKIIEEHLMLSSNSKILDVGCGNGFFTVFWQKRTKTIGVDFSFKMLKLNPANTLVQADVMILPFKDNSFDLVFCANLLHHVAIPEQALKEMARVSKKYVAIIEPNRNNPLMFLFGLFKKIERGTLKFSKQYVKKLFDSVNLQEDFLTVQGIIAPNKTPTIMLPLLKKFDFQQPFGLYIIATARKTKYEDQ